MRKLALVLAVGSLCSPALAGQILSLTDGASPSVYANGSGTGFGGTLGSGQITFDAVGTNLVVTFNNSASLQTNIVTLYLDTVAGGFTDATMNDTGDPGRNVISNLARDGTEVLPTMGNGLPDYAINFRAGGTELFGLGSPLNFIQSGVIGSITLPLSSIGNPDSIDFIAVLTSDTNFLSNESLPGHTIGSNPGYGGGVTYSNYNEFVIRTPVQPPVIIPLPPAMLAGAALLAVTGIARRR